MKFQSPFALIYGRLHLPKPPKLHFFTKTESLLNWAQSVPEQQILSRLDNFLVQFSSSRKYTWWKFRFEKRPCIIKKWRVAKEGDETFRQSGGGLFLTSPKKSGSSVAVLLILETDLNSLPGTFIRALSIYPTIPVHPPLTSDLASIGKGKCNSLSHAQNKSWLFVRKSGVILVVRNGLVGDHLANGNGHVRPEHAAHVAGEHGLLLRLRRVLLLLLTSE